MFKIFSPITNRAKAWMVEILDSTDFIALCDNQLIATEVWGSGNFLSTAHDFRNEILTAGAPEQFSLLPRLKAISTENWLRYFHPGAEAPIAQSIMESAFALLSDNPIELDPSQQDMLLDIFNHGTTPNWSDVSRFMFRIGTLVSEPRVKIFSRRFAMSIYEIGDQYPGRLPVPYMGPALGDSPLRFSSISGSLALLQSPRFLRQFLLQFIDPCLIDRIALLSPDQIVELHSQSFWRAYLDEFHHACQTVSKTLRLLPEEEIEASVVNEMARIFRLNDNKEVTLFELVYGGLFFAMHLPFLSFSPKASSLMESFKKRTHLYLAHRDLQRFLDWINKALRNTYESQNA